MTDDVYDLPFGDATLSVRLPDCDVDTAVPAGGEAVDPGRPPRPRSTSRTAPRSARSSTRTTRWRSSSPT
nr:hypothetical protein [Halobaculum sp. DT92]